LLRWTAVVLWVVDLTVEECLGAVEEVVPMSAEPPPGAAEVKLTPNMQADASARMAIRVINFVKLLLG
jgi:hypothetical protein